MLTDSNINMDEKLTPQTKSFFRKPIFLIVLILIIGFCVFGLYYSGILTSQLVEPENNLKEITASDLFVKQADDSQILAELPKGLILGKDVVILASVENVSTSTVWRTFNTSYKTKLTPKELEKGYLAFIKDNNFELLSNSGTDKGFFSIAAYSKDYTQSFKVSLIKGSQNQEDIVTVIFNLKK